MNNQQRSSMVRVLTGVSILLFIALLAIAYTLIQGRNTPSEEPAPFGEETAASVANTPSPIEITSTPAPIATPEPTAIPSPTAAPDLTFGAISMRNGCDAYTDIIVSIIETELRLDVEVIEYDGPDALFEDIANSDIDFTLCFGGTADRQYISEHLGKLNVYTNRYVDEGDIWMQPVVAARKQSAFQEEQPCLHRLINKFEFSLADAYVSAESWIENNNDAVVEWSNCQS